MLQTGVNNQVVGIVTQSMIISLIDQNLHRFGALRTHTVNDIVPGLVASLVTIDCQAPALNAYQKMSEFNISGLAVTNLKGELVDSISTKNLRLLGYKVHFYNRLLLTVEKYCLLDRKDEREENVWNINNICVDITDTFETVIKKMKDGNVHSLYVCKMNSKQMIPTHVITQRDIIRYVLYRLGMSPVTTQESPEFV